MEKEIDSLIEERQSLLEKRASKKIGSIAD